MWILLVGLTSGLIASTWAGNPQEVRFRGCSHVGVFHVQGNNRYTLSFDDAKDLCQHLGAELASYQQVNVAYEKGLETCRYGWINDGNVTILRRVSNALCANGTLGVIINPNAENDLWDAYCYDQNDLSDKNCTLYLNLDSLPQESDPAPSEPSVTTDSSSSSPVHIVTEDKNNVLYGSTSTAPSVTSGLTTTAVAEATGKTAPSDDPTDIFTILDSESLLNATSSPVTIDESDVEDRHTTTSEIKQEKYHSTQSSTMSTEAVTENSFIYDPNESSGMAESTTIATMEPHMNNGSRKLVYPAGNTNKETTDSNLTEDPPTDVDNAPSVEEEVTFEEKGAPDQSSPDSNKSSRNDLVVIVIVVLAIVLLLLLCLLYVMRNRWCGKSKTLMITKSGGEGNGTAAVASSAQAQEREQEMVTLMNKEKIQENGNTEEFTVITLEESPEKNEQA